jgi:acetaldehyde dehydrogenase (acetylating)
MTALPELPEPYNCGGDATIAALLRAYGRQCYAAGMELAAQIADKHSGPSTLASENSDMYSIQNRWAKVIAKAIRGTGAAS